MKFTVWWSALQRMNTKKSSIQSDTLEAEHPRIEVRDWLGIVDVERDVAEL